jgi:hypothetical protein
MLAMYVAEFGCTGNAVGSSMRVFHGLSAGKIVHPPIEGAPLAAAKAPTAATGADAPLGDTGAPLVVAAPPLVGDVPASGVHGPTVKGALGTSFEASDAASSSAAPASAVPREGGGEASPLFVVAGAARPASSAVKNPCPSAFVPGPHDAAHAAKVTKRVRRA